MKVPTCVPMPKGLGKPLNQLRALDCGLKSETFHMNFFLFTGIGIFSDGIFPGWYFPRLVFIPS